MASANPFVWWRGFCDLPNESLSKTVGVALVVAMVCSLMISITAVTLRPLQDANRLADRNARMLAMLAFLGEGVPHARFVDLATGTYVDRDSGTDTELPPDRDPAGLGRREDVATVFEMREESKLMLVVLPVRGVGYQSMLKGYLALKADLNTVAALIFYEQDETPGLGARVEEDAWHALWPGKQVADAEGVIRIAVVKGAGKGVHEVDGISGATRTSAGVTKLLQFWLGRDGYRPYLERLRIETGR